ncbi:Hypp7698 [Branchiostoma lanceolatum]|uniref:Hypp7698 protein n=1 Tax=Branchiostoma lanceolatum TaxID=7740 RepID=A0A8K0EET7_BRALA|nr:Hypp7698 [Branchiostoma lanceolatum]
MSTTCGAYHLEALRRQQVLDRKQLALQRLAQKEFGMSWDNPFHPDLRPDVLLQDSQPWSPDMTEGPKPFSPDMGRPTTADMMPQDGPMDGPPMFGPSGGGCDSPSELVQPDGGMGDLGAPRFIDVPKSARNGSRLGTPPSRAGSGMPGSARSGSAVPFSPIMDDGEGGRADSQMSDMSEPVVPPNLQQAARAAGAVSSSFLTPSITLHLPCLTAEAPT